MSRLFTEHLCSALAHFGNELSVVIEPELNEAITNNPELLDEMEKKIETLRHQLGSAHVAARELRDLFKYGQKLLEDRREVQEDE